MHPPPKPQTSASDALAPARRGPPQEAHVALDEGALIAAAVRGDRDAFDRLAVRLLPRLVGTARRLLRDPAEAEEAVAATLVRTHAALAGFRGAAALSTWSHRILLRIAADLVRRRARERTRNGSWPSDEPAATDGGPLEAVERGEERARVRAAVELLPTAQRLVVMLVAWEGLSLAEAGVVLGMRYATVKSNLHHARAGLERLLLGPRCSPASPQRSPGTTERA